MVRCYPAGQPKPPVDLRVTTGVGEKRIQRRARGGGTGRKASRYARGQCHQEKILGDRWLRWRRRLERGGQHVEPALDPTREDASTKRLQRGVTCFAGTH